MGGKLNESRVQLYSTGGSALLPLPCHANQLARGGKAVPCRAVPGPTYPGRHLQAALQLTVDPPSLVVHQVDGAADPSVLPLAVLPPPGHHQHAEQNPADAEAQVARQVDRVEEEHGPAQVHQALHQDPVDGGRAQLVSADREAIGGVRSLHRTAPLQLSGGCHEGSGAAGFDQNLGLWRQEELGVGIAAPRKLT